LRTPSVSQEGSSSFVSGSADGRCNLVSSASLNMVSCSAPLLEGGSILRGMMLLLSRVLLATVFTGGPFFFTTLQDEFVGVCQRRDLALRRGVRTRDISDAQFSHLVRPLLVDRASRFPVAICLGTQVPSPLLVERLGVGPSGPKSQYVCCPAFSPS
jgi:hypothetical protein